MSMTDRIQLDGKTYIPLAAAMEMSGVSEAAVRQAAERGEVWLRAAGKKVYVELESLRRFAEAHTVVSEQSTLEPAHAPTAVRYTPSDIPTPVSTSARQTFAAPSPVRTLPARVRANTSRMSAAKAGVLSVVVLVAGGFAFENISSIGKVVAHIGNTFHFVRTSQTAAVGATGFGGTAPTNTNALASTSPTYSVTSPQPLTASSNSATSLQPIYYVYNYPVIERVQYEVRNIAATSTADFSRQLQELYNTMQGRIQALGQNVGTQTTNVYNSVATMGRIEHLDELDLTNPTLTGASISASSLSVTGNGTSTFSSGLNLTSGCLSVQGVCLGNGSSVTGNSGQVAYFSGTDTAIGTSTISISAAGNVGIGTTTPFRKFSITDTVSTAQAVVAYDATRYAELRVDSTGDLNIGPSGNDTFLNNDNLWVCTGGSISSNGCPSGTPTGAGNIIVENKLGIGTSTPAYKLTIETQDSTTNFLQIASSTAPSIFLITKDGKVGIGTSTPSAQLAASGLLFVGANGATGMGTATSTFQGDIRITGKLDVGTIDPVYTIDGVKYATYGSAQVGIKEEVSFKATLSKWDEKKQMYVYAIDFSKLEKGSDVWLFYQVTDFGKYWENLIVTLASGFDGRVFYEEAPQKGVLNIYASEQGSVSIRLVANRFDFTKWKNLRPDQDDQEYKGFELRSK